MTHTGCNAESTYVLTWILCECYGVGCEAVGESALTLASGSPDPQAHQESCIFWDKWKYWVKGQIELSNAGNSLVYTVWEKSLSSSFDGLIIACLSPLSKDFWINMEIEVDKKLFGFFKMILHHYSNGQVVLTMMSHLGHEIEGEITRYQKTAMRREIRYRYGRYRYGRYRYGRYRYGRNRYGLIWYVRER